MITKQDHDHDLVTGIVTASVIAMLALWGNQAKAEEAVNANVEFLVHVPVIQMQAMQSSWEMEGAQLTNLTHMSKDGGAGHTFVLGKTWEANVSEFVEAAASKNVPLTVTAARVWGSRESLDRIKEKHPDVVAGYSVRESEQPTKENVDTSIPISGDERLGNNAPVQQ